MHSYQPFSRIDLLRIESLYQTSDANDSKDQYYSRHQRANEGEENDEIIQALVRIHDHKTCLECHLDVKENIQADQYAKVPFLPFFDFFLSQLTDHDWKIESKFKVFNCKIDYIQKPNSVTRNPSYLKSTQIFLFQKKK